MIWFYSISKRNCLVLMLLLYLCCVVSLVIWLFYKFLYHFIINSLIFFTNSFRIILLIKFRFAFFKGMILKSGSLLLFLIFFHSVLIKWYLSIYNIWQYSTSILFILYVYTVFCRIWKIRIFNTWMETWCSITHRGLIFLEINVIL